MFSKKKKQISHSEKVFFVKKALFKNLWSNSKNVFLKKTHFSHSGKVLFVKKAHFSRQNDIKNIFLKSISLRKCFFQKRYISHSKKSVFARKSTFLTSEKVPFVKKTLFSVFSNKHILTPQEVYSYGLLGGAPH